MKHYELGEKMKKGENCTKKGLKGLKIASFWVINSKKSREGLPPPPPCHLKGGGGNDRNAQYIPPDIRLFCTAFCTAGLAGGGRQLAAEPLLSRSHPFPQTGTFSMQF